MTVDSVSATGLLSGRARGGGFEQRQHGRPAQLATQDTRIAGGAHERGYVRSILLRQVLPIGRTDEGQKTPAAIGILGACRDGQGGATAGLRQWLRR